MATETSATAVVPYAVARLRPAGAPWDAGEVVPGLWVGSLAAAESAEDLASHGIARVVTVASRLRPELPAGVEHVTVELDDHPTADLLGALPAALDAIGTGTEVAAGGGVLVHCASGVSRSVAACVAWLQVRRGLRLEDALRAVREARPQGQPNLGFMQALQLLEASSGDVPAAAAKWQEVNRAGLQERVIGLREAANGLHARVDALEEELAQRRSAGVAAPLSPELRVRLEQLQLDLDQAAPQHEVDDRVARSIRKAAAQKVARLLDEGIAPGNTT